MRGVLALTGLIAALTLLGGGRAFAHAQLVSADPAAGTVVAEAPETVALTFSEPVRTLTARWFLTGSAPVEAVPEAEGERLVVPVPEGTGTGTLLLSWRVVSADGHPIAGSHAFSIGAPTSETYAPAAGQALAAAVGQGLLTISLVFGVGGTVFLRLVDRKSMPTPAARSIALWSARAVAPTALLASGLHGLDLLGAPGSALLGPAPWCAALASPFAGTVTASLIAGVAAMAALHRSGTIGGTFAVVAWILAAISFSLFGHAATASPRWLTAPAVALHAGAFIFWLGALPGLAESALRARHDLASTLHRFSALAVPIVALLLLSGVTIAAVQLRQPSDLLDTPYGLLLTAKLAAVAFLLLLAALNLSRLTPAIDRGAPRAQDRFRRSVSAEIVMGIMILGLASGFRLTPPPRAVAAAASSGIHVHLHGPTVTAGVSLVNGEAGTNGVEIRLQPEIDPLEVQISFADPAHGVEPIRLEAVRDGGTWRAGPVFLPHGGDWMLTLDVLVSDFAKETLETNLAMKEP